MRKLVNTLGIFLISLFIMTGVKAGSLGISASKTSAYVGDSVVITVSANGLAGKFGVTSSNGNVLSGGTSSTWIDSSSQTFVFKANGTGSATITASPQDVADYSTGNSYTGARSVTVNVINRPVATLSGDNSLTSLEVEGYTLSEEFNKDKLEYAIELNPETTKINIKATPASGATVSGAGEVEVKDGDNRLEIIVTAENGSQRTYIINANVKEYDPVIVKIDNKDYTVIRKKGTINMPNGYEETTININGNDVPAYKSKTTKYTLVGLKDSSGNSNLYIYDNGKYTLYKEYTFNNVILFPIDNVKDIPKGYQKTTIVYNEEKITAYKLNNSSKYALIYGMNVETGETHLYMYDAKEDTIQIYNDEEVKSLTKTNSLYLKLFIGVSVLAIIQFIIIIVLLVKRNKKKVEINEI